MSLLNVNLILDFLKKIVKNHQKRSKKLFVLLKNLILLTFQVKNPKKKSNLVSRTFHMESLIIESVWSVPEFQANFQ